MIIAMVGTDLRKFRIGLIRLYTTLEILDKIPVEIAKIKDIKKPNRLLNNEYNMILRKFGSFNMFIKLLVVLPIVGKISSLLIIFASINHSPINIILVRKDKLLSFIVESLIWNLAPYNLWCIL